MTKNKIGFAVIIVILIIAVIIFLRWCNTDEKCGDVKAVIKPVMGEIVSRVATTGVVEPQNRLEIKPSIAGRIDKILVKEGDSVMQGDTLAWMSSTERAALIDAARSQSDEVLAYWEEVYKKTPIISPINGEIIVRAIEPGQTVTTQDAILVLSDRLVVSAQFDETDIGKVELNQKAFITLDAYPEIEIEGVVDHIAYESEIVNNVTIYDVDILPNQMPKTLRSGMSVTVEVVEEEKKDVLIVPSKAIHYDGKKEFVMLLEKNGSPRKCYVDTGLSDGKNTEIISGLSLNNNVLVQSTAYLPKKKSAGTNPFMPQRNRKK
ncbi:MAG: efflux RND transporter periplasmic adaptor subunit [Candidatus Omnitrophota bacterium]